MMVWMLVVDMVKDSENPTKSGMVDRVVKVTKAMMDVPMYKLKAD